MNINYLIFFRSTIGKKVITAITGIFLMIFLLLHLSVNLFLFCGEKQFNNAVYFMKNNIIIRIMEYVLALGFIIHIIIGIILFFHNKKVKGKINYSINNSSSITSFSSRTMIFTGILILCFLVLHLINFTIPMKYYTGAHMSNYNLVTSLFKNPFYTLIYVLSFIILGIHLNHGFQSSFQSLGLSKNKNIFLIKKLGLLYFLFISIGFSSIAIWFFFN